jgi:hypothetical protein
MTTEYLYTIIHFLMRRWFSDTLSLFASKTSNNSRQPGGSVQLLALFESKNQTVSQDQSDMTTEKLWKIIHFLMWLWSPDTLSFFVSKTANNWREPPSSIPLLALFETKNKKVFEDQSHMKNWIILYNFSVVMSLWYSDALSFFA